MRAIALGAAVLGAGTVGGYLGSVLADMEQDRVGQASHSMGMPGLEVASLRRGPGKFERFGRSVDDFNAQLDENWQIWASIGRYVFSQGQTELKRVWTSPPAIAEPTQGPSSHQMATAAAEE